MPSTQDRLRQGHALQMQGKLAEASTIYREVLAAEPRNAPALHLLGVLVMQAGQVEQGLQMVRDALAILPGFAPAHENLGKGLEKLGRKEEALASFGRVIALAPGHAEGYGHRGRVLESLHRYTEALRDFEKALSLKPDPALALNRGAVLLQLHRNEDALASFDKAIAMGFTGPLAYFNRAVALVALNRPEDALASYDSAITRQPDYITAFVNRGLVLESLGRTEEALESYDRALTIDPDFPEARINRVVLLGRMGRKQEALAGYDEVIARQPDFAIAYNNRGSALKSMGEMEKALADFDQAIALKPEEASFHDNRANTLQGLKRFDEAMAAFDCALTLDPGAERSQFHKGMLLLLLGRFAEGWPLYEKRKRIAAPPNLDPALVWRGPSQNVAGKTIFVYAEQGLGDIILFSRYLDSLALLGAKIVFAVREPLTRLLRGLVPAVTLVPEDTRPPAHNFHVPMCSLPLLFGTTEETVPAAVPYLKPEPERIAKWRDLIGADGFRIGIAWQGMTKGANDPDRSFPLTALAPLAKIPGVRLISLQKGEGREQLAGLPKGMTVESLGENFDAGFDAFIDCAAAMETLDLVVTCDTSIAHLAGALARPVWVALKQVPEWRWQMDRDDSPWYPTMTLIRQSARGDWDGVFTSMAKKLRSLARKSKLHA